MIDKKWDVDMVSKFAEFFFNFKLYDYQIKFLDKCLKYNRVAGKWPRQSGKSQTVAVYSLFRALTGKCVIVIVAPTQTQSSELYNKIRDMASANPAIMKVMKKSTETEMIIDKSRIIALPSGPEGKTIRGFTADVVIIEEAGFMKDLIVNTVITPMIASKGNKGQIIKIGTPWTRNHFYRSCFEDAAYQNSVVSISWKDVLNAGQYNQDFINEQKLQLSSLEFQTEYEGMFIFDANAFFPISVLDGCKETYTLFSHI